MAIEPIKGFYVHDEVTDTDGVAKVSIEAVQEFEDDIRDETSKWLDDHPEATTTVQDGAITATKLSNGAVIENKVDADFLKTIENAYVTPEMFGAVGNGTTDDTQAFVDMFAYNGAYYYIPQKTYKITELSITKNEIFVTGSGAKSHIVCDGFVTFNGHDNKVNNFLITGGDGLRTVNGYANTFSGVMVSSCKYGFYGENAYITQFDNCYFRNNKVGVRLHNQSYETVFSNCVIDNNIIGALLTGGTSGVVLNNCTIEGNRDRDTSKGLGVLCATTSARLVIRDCWLESNGTAEGSTDITIYTSSPVEDNTTITELITAAIGEMVTLNTCAGALNVEGCQFYATPTQILLGGDQLMTVISGNMFSGVSGRNNRAIVLNVLQLTNNLYDIFGNSVVNTNNQTITAEMLQGICGTYIYYDRSITNTTWIAHLRTGVVFYNNKPLFTPTLRTTELTDSTIIKLNSYSSNGTKHVAPGYKGEESAYYEGATTIYGSTDGTSSGINLFPEVDVEYTFTVISSSNVARRNTTNGWTTFGKIGPDLYSVATNTASNKYLFFYNLDTPKALVIFGANDKLKVKQALGVRFSDIF